MLSSQECRAVASCFIPSILLFHRGKGKEENDQIVFKKCLVLPETGAHCENRNPVSNKFIICYDSNGLVHLEKNL